MVEIWRERRQIGDRLDVKERDGRALRRLGKPEPIFVNVYGAQESIPGNRFRQPL